MVSRLEYKDKKGWFRLEKPEKQHLSDNGFVELHSGIDETLAGMFFFLMESKYPNLKRTGMELEYPSNQTMLNEFENFKSEYDIDG
jgi:hypothetical protein